MCQRRGVDQQPLLADSYDNMALAFAVRAALFRLHVAVENSIDLGLHIC